jgi:hypothetical protein
MQGHLRGVRHKRLGLARSGHHKMMGVSRLMCPGMVTS